MKVVYVSNLYGELARGGAERIVEAEARAFAARDADAVIVTAERRRDVPKGVCLPGEPWLCPPPGSEAQVREAYAAAQRRAARPGEPRVIRYHPPNLYFYADDGRQPYLRRFLWHLKDMGNAASARTFARILDLERPDVVHTHNLMGLGFLLPREIRRRGARHVHTVHDVQLLHPSGIVAGDGRRVSFAARAYMACMRRLMGSPDVVVFPSRFLEGLHVRHGFFPRSRRVVIANPAPPAAAVRQAPDACRFLFVGQLEAHKGVRTLLDAWERARPQRASLEIAGSGSLEAEVRERAGRLKGVSVLGRLAGESLSAAYDRAAYVVVPSEVIENQPTVILEAFARGTPVVASGVGGIPELVAEGETGHLCRPADVDALSDVMLQAASLAGWQAMSANCLAWARSHGVEAHVAALAGIYEAGGGR